MLTEKEIIDLQKELDSKYQKQEEAASQVADLVLLVSRLIHAVRIKDPENPVAEKAMDYLRRKDLFPSIVQGVNQHIKKQMTEAGEKPVLFSYPCFHCAKKIEVRQLFCNDECGEKYDQAMAKEERADHESGK